jgi:hypothetical protein
MRAQNEPEIVVMDKNLTAAAKRHMMNKKLKTTVIKDIKKLGSRVFDSNTPSMFDEVREESSQSSHSFSSSEDQSSKMARKSKV